MKTTIIGCKLPHGINLIGSMAQVVHINGVNTSLVAGGIGLTHVPEDEAAYLFAQYAEFQPVVSQAIFSLGGDSVADVVALADELKDEKTGFEGLNPEAPAPGLKPEGDVGKALELAETKPRPSIAPATRADKAAAKAAAKLAGA